MTIDTHHDTLEAERALLGATLADRDVAVDVFKDIKPEHFTLTEHQVIARTVERLIGRNEPVDLVTVTRKLTAKAIERLKAPGKTFRVMGHDAPRLGVRVGRNWTKNHFSDFVTTGGRRRQLSMEKTRVVPR